MIVLLNGAFGIGKTTVAQIIARQTSDCKLVNPERIGLALQFGARALFQRGDDFQDLRLWRTGTLLRLRLAARGSGTVIVPMAISNPQYLREIADGLERRGIAYLHLCLIAPVSTVHARLQLRAADRIRNAWEYRRAAECCVLHQGPQFQRHIDAATETPDQVAQRVIGLMAGNSQSKPAEA